MGELKVSYTALEKMQKRNREAYGINYPVQPADYRVTKEISSIEKACIGFIRELCEELRFDEGKSAMTDLDGKSVGENQIPYNMEMDLDRLCLERAIHRFMESGVAHDAFDVYFCYLEMFLGNYGKSKKMIEMLAEFESNASSLLMKHRDHYSHSVYVFILGLAIYYKNELVRKAYMDFYQIYDEKKAAYHFLEYWGLSSLFHDIGYPFELPFEQVKSYFGNTIKGVPFVAYKGISEFIQFTEEEKAYFEELLGQELDKGTVDEILSVNIAEKLEKVYGKSADMICNAVLNRIPGEPDHFNGFMDHAYFSAMLLYKNLSNVLGAQRIEIPHLDAMTAIALHNSMYKFSITNVRDEKINIPFDMNLHPLAYVLMLCDELQCWDRTSYGQNSRRELHAMWCDIEFEGNNMKATYYYDEKYEYKKDTAKGSYKKMTDADVTFMRDIERIMRINKEDTIGLSIDTAFIKNNRKTRTYISSSNFIHLYNFAVALNGRYQNATGEGVTDMLEDSFDKLSLEYKLSNIMQAKAFARYLDIIGAFYTDKPVAYEMLDSFTEKDMQLIGPMEHKRWVDEKISMGWNYETTYQKESDKKKQRSLREQTRTHALIIDDYHELAESEQNKDTEPMNCMLRLIEEYDGLRIYRI